MQLAGADADRDETIKSQWGVSAPVWALLGIVLLAAVLRFWALGDLPPGLYRDEAFNGLDALSVLDGNHALFFAANNGREPAYIYLTAAFVSLFGRTAFAVRFAAALVGTLTTIPVFMMAGSWFGRRVGLLTALLWAITVWPIHLSRIGFRAILLPFFLALLFWLGTEAYRRGKWWLWLVAGVVYGLSWYSYLAVRMTPLLLGLFFLYLIWQRRGRRLWPGVLWFVLGACVALLPMAILFVSSPETILGRSGQVSVFHPDINQGDLWGTLWQHFGRTAGMFLWRGDDIVRHNPPGRPVFDLFMALPAIAGVIWCLLRRRQPAAALTLLWVGVMLLPTILAEDAPHFLRAVGVLPAVLIFPALGLSLLLSWSKLSGALRITLALLLILGNFALTWNAYFQTYANQTETSLLFEGSARHLAEEANAAAANGNVIIDERLWDGWPSIRFLTDVAVTLTDAEQNVSVMPPVTVFAWPFEQPSYLMDVTGPVTVAVASGPLARGDLDDTALPLYTRYTLQPGMVAAHSGVNFGDMLELHGADVAFSADDTLAVTLTWQPLDTLQDDVSVFVQLVDAQGIVAQDDAPLGRGLWPQAWLRQDMQLQQTHHIVLTAPFDKEEQQLIVGLYRPNGNRIPVLDEAKREIDDYWQLQLP